jgi:hypothetical protein
MLPWKRYFVVGFAAYLVEVLTGVWSYGLAHNLPLLSIIASLIFPFASLLGVAIFVECKDDWHCQLRVAMATSIGYAVGTVTTFLVAPWLHS